MRNTIAIIARHQTSKAVRPDFGGNKSGLKVKIYRRETSEKWNESESKADIKGEEKVKVWRK